MSKERQGGGSWPQIGRKSRSSSSGPTKNGVKLVSYCGQCKQERRALDSKRALV